MPLNNRVRKSILELTPCIHGANVLENAEEVGKKADELLDFSVNLNPLFPPGFNKIISNSYETIKNYPDNRYLDFRRGAAHYLDVSPENIIPGNGSSELIRLFAETVIEHGDRAIIPSPTFGEYEIQCRLFGANIQHERYADILKIEPEDTKAVFLCNPNNPTGKLIKKSKVLELAEKCIAKETFLFVDEAFIELSDPKESVTDFASSHDFVIVLRSLTKAFAIPGLRVGFAVASPDLSGFMNNIRLPWNLNSIGLAVGEKLLQNNRRYLDRSLSLIKQERQRLISQLGAIRGFKPYPSDANFILIDVGDFFLTSSELAERVLKHGIIIRECSSFSLKNHIRVAVKKRTENQKLIKVFTHVISEWGNEIAEKELKTALERGTSARSRFDCEYYPCHFEGQDCTFCFCPFYPCENEKTGGEFIHRSTGGKIWSCSGCSLIHKGEIADKVLRALMNGKSIKDVWRLVMEPVL